MFNVSQYLALTCDEATTIDIQSYISYYEKMMSIATCLSNCNLVLSSIF